MELVMGDDEHIQGGRFKHSWTGNSSRGIDLIKALWKLNVNTHSDIPDVKINKNLPQSVIPSWNLPSLCSTCIPLLLLPNLQWSLIPKYIFTNLLHRRQLQLLLLLSRFRKIIFSSNQLSICHKYLDSKLPFFRGLFLVVLSVSFFRSVSTEISGEKMREAL